MHRVGRAGRNQPHVEHAAGLPGVALVDGVAFAIELVGAVEMRALLHRAAAVVLHAAAPRQNAAAGIARLELQPDVEAIHGAAGKEVADLAGAHHGIDAHGRAGRETSRRARRWARRSCRLRGSPSARSVRLPRRRANVEASAGASAARRRISIWPLRLFDRAGGEQIHRDEARLQELLRGLQLLVVVIHGRESRCWRRGSDASGPCRRDCRDRARPPAACGNRRRLDGFGG